MPMPVRFSDVETAYAKNAKLRREDVRGLQAWMEKQSHLPKIPELMAMMFLHSCYYKMEEAKACVEKYYTMRANCPELFANRNVNSASIQQQLKLSLMTVLPTTTKEGFNIFITRLVDGDSETYNYTEMTKAFDMSTTLDRMQIGISPGQVLVMDFTLTSFGHFLKVNLSTTKTWLQYVQEALPVRLKGVHLINVSPIAEKFIGLAMAFFKKETMDVFHTHTSLDTLFDYVPKEALPNEYGGQAGTIKELHEKAIANLLENADYFEREEREISDETKRLAKRIDADAIFGTEGTFRKLVID